jgi:hypothetical protein
MRMRNASLMAGFAFSIEQRAASAESVLGEWLGFDVSNLTSDGQCRNENRQAAKNERRRFGGRRRSLTCGERCVALHTDTSDLQRKGVFLAISVNLAPIRQVSVRDL